MQKRSKEKLSKTLILFKKVLKNRTYLFYTLELSFSLAILFAYIASSLFIIQEHYGFSPIAFSLFFAANAVLIGIGTAISVKFKSQQNCLATSCVGMTLCSMALE